MYKTITPIAYNQQQILDASAVAILGDLEAYKNVEPVYGPIVEQGFMKEEAKERLAKILNLHMLVNNSQEMLLFKCIFSSNATYAEAKNWLGYLCYWWLQSTSTDRRI